MRPPQTAAPSPPAELGAAQEVVKYPPVATDRQRHRTPRRCAGPSCARTGGDSGAAVTARRAWGARAPGRGDVATVLDPIGQAYAGIDPAIDAPLLRWAWLRAFGNDSHAAVVTATAEAISQRRPWRRAQGM